MKIIKTLYHLCNEAFFHVRGLKPWTRGYAEYKRRSIIKALASGFNPESLPKAYGYRLDERIVEYPWFFSRIPNGNGKLLDAGSVLNFDYILEMSSIKNKKLFISTLAPEVSCHWQQGISYVYEDLRESCFREGYFDWIASLSTIEHIGLDNTMLYTSDVSMKENHRATCLEAIKEYKRMLKPGGTLYLSFPFGKHENRGWFQIFDEAMLDEVIAAFSPAKVSEFHFRYQEDGWVPSSREESKNATYFDIHTEKEYKATFVAASEAIVCLELTK